MKTNHKRQFKSNSNHRNVYLKGTSLERGFFLRRFWKKFRYLSKEVIRKEEFEKLPFYKSDEYWENS